MAYTDQGHPLGRVPLAHVGPAGRYVAVGGERMDAIAEIVAGHVIDVPDFPKPGIVFKDLSPLFADGPAFRTVVDAVAARYGSSGFDVVAGIEARGFLLAAALSYATRA